MWWEEFGVEGGRVGVEELIASLIINFHFHSVFLRCCQPLS